MFVFLSRGQSLYGDFLLDQYKLSNLAFSFTPDKPPILCPFAILCPPGHQYLPVELLVSAHCYIVTDWTFPIGARLTASLENIESRKTWNQTRNICLVCLILSIEVRLDSSLLVTF